MDFLNDLISAPFICIGWIIVGIIAGSLARRLMQAKDQPIIVDLILGIAGALVGGLIAGILGLGPDDNSGGLGLVIANLVIATMGAALLIGIRRTVMK